ncbi:MAG: acyl-CoA dehydrogenase family protein [Ectothiorhodospiraceae bacterium]|nr:acyl-CoA dehydrogenase family protein [Ectothiorhodospiraceae bacterium]
MDFQHSAPVQELQQRLTAFMEEHVYPNEHVFQEQVQAQRWKSPPVLEELKAKARDAGLWNLFMPDPAYGPGLSNLEYAPLAEIMGRVFWAAEVFNCNAPDTGNMEVFVKYGTAEQKERWLKPLLEGKIRSAFAMTEPAVASSDATNVETRIERDGDHYVINGRKWFITNAMHERCEIFIVMGKSDPDNPNRHLQQTQILVPRDASGLRVVRPLSTFGYFEEPGGHAEVVFENVRVPKENLLLGEGRGFEVAQGRLGPGRIHHCMRLIGAAQRGLEAACQRVEQRHVFGGKLSQQGSVRESIAQMASKVEMARLLTLKAADKMDRVGTKEARDLIAMAKIMVPQLAQEVLDMAIQMHGAGGLTADYFMAEAYNYARWCRMADGPDQVHMMALGKQVIRQYAL